MGKPFDGEVAGEVKVDRGANVKALPVPRRIRFLSLEELANMERPRPLISGVLYSNMEHVLFAQQGFTKTFLALDMCLHMAHQRRWMGIPVQHAKTVYVYGEGGGVLLADRINAWLQHHDITDTTATNEFLRVTASPVPLMELDWVEVLIADIERDGGAHFVVIDTLAANFGGGDENSNADMRVFCDAMRRIRLRTGAGIMVIHHTGHADRTRPQGGNILRRNVDIELRIDRDANDHALFGVVGGGDLKSRHGKGCALLPYRLQTVELCEKDTLGQPIKSAVIVPAEDVPRFEGHRGSSMGLGSNQRTGLAILKRIAEETKQDPASIKDVYISSVDWSRLCRDAGLDRRRQSEVLRAFRKKHWVHDAIGGFKWCPDR